MGQHTRVETSLTSFGSPWAQNPETSQEKRLAGSFQPWESKSHKQVQVESNKEPKKTQEQKLA